MSEQLPGKTRNLAPPSSPPPPAPPVLPASQPPSGDLFAALAALCNRDIEAQFQERTGLTFDQAASQPPSGDAPDLREAAKAMADHMDGKHDNDPSGCLVRDHLPPLRAALAASQPPSGDARGIASQWWQLQPPSGDALTINETTLRNAWARLDQVGDPKTPHSLWKHLRNEAQPPSGDAPAYARDESCPHCRDGSPHHLASGDAPDLREAARAHVESECRCRGGGSHDDTCDLIVTEEALRVALDASAPSSPATPAPRPDALAYWRKQIADRNVPPGQPWTDADVMKVVADLVAAATPAPLALPRAEWLREPCMEPHLHYHVLATPAPLEEERLARALEAVNFLHGQPADYLADAHELARAYANQEGGEPRYLTELNTDLAGDETSPPRP